VNRRIEDAPAIKWLLEESNPAVRYRTHPGIAIDQSTRMKSSTFLLVFL